MSALAEGASDICPFCASTETEGESVDTDSHSAAQGMYCLTCKGKWIASYTFVGNVHQDAGEFPDTLQDFLREKRDDIQRFHFNGAEWDAGAQAWSIPVEAEFDEAEHTGWMHGTMILNRVGDEWDYNVGDWTPGNLPNTCKRCHALFDPMEVRRIFGEGLVERGYCTARCFTRDAIQDP